MIDERTSQSKCTETLHQAAAWMKAHPSIPIMSINLYGDHPALMVYNLHTKEDAQAFVHEVGNVTKKISNGFFRLYHKPPGANFTVEAVFSRDAVCTSKVVGTKEVTKEVPTKFETQTVTEDIIEWECGPLMEGEK